MNNIDKILTGIIQKHSDHTYKGSIYKDGNQGIQVIVNRILKKSNIDIVLKIQTCMLLYLCEHKIKRGFCPIETYSAHWIRDIRFKEAIDDFLNRERVHILQYNEDRKSLLPFRKEIISNLYEKI